MPMQFHRGILYLCPDNYQGMRIKLLPIVALMAFMLSCSKKGPMPNTEVDGIFPAMAGRMVYLEELEPRRSVLMDSMLIEGDGLFQFRLRVDDAGFYILHSSDDDNLLLLLEEGEKAVVRSESDAFDTDVSIEGSPGSRYILDFERFMDLQRQRLDSLAEVYEAHRGDEEFLSVKKTLDSLYLSYLDDQRNLVFNFIDTHPGSLASLILINRRLGQAEVIDEEKDYLYLHRIDSLLQISHPGNKHTKDHHERVAEIKGRIFDRYVSEEKLRPGKKAPDVVLNDTTGHPVSLKSYTGRQVILYFWAGWDAKSRALNRELTVLYPDLRSKNTEILGISLDENEIVWKGAIRLDHLSWPQVSDLKGFYSDVGKAYNIREKIPFFYLIDEQQKIKYKSAELDSILIRLNQ